MARGKDGVRAALDLGADSAVDGKVADVAAAARAFAAGGLDAVLTFVAGPGFDTSISGTDSNQGIGMAMMSAAGRDGSYATQVRHTVLRVLLGAGSVG